MAYKDFYRDDEFSIYAAGYEPASDYSTTGDDSGGFLSGISNWWKKITGSGTSTAQKEANAYSSREAELNRQWQSSEAALNRNFQAKQAEEAYQRQVDFYNTYQSPSAMVQQYKDAGLNPALMVGGNVGQTSVPSSSAPSGSMPSGSAPSGYVDSGDPSGVLSFIMNLLGFRSRLSRMNAETANINADTAQKEKQTSWLDSYNTTNIESLKAGIDKVRSDIKVNSSLIDKNIQDIAESMKRVDVHDSTISVNNALIDLHGSQKVLNETRSAVEKLNASTIEAMLPYVQARQEAEIALQVAKTEEARASAEDKMYDANLKMLRGLVEAKLVDSSYYDDVISQAHWSTKAKKREYKWAPVNDICHNMSMLLIGAGSVMSGSASVVTAFAKQPSGIKEVATMNYF